MSKELPPPELLRKLLRYEPETGKLFWRERTPDMFTNTGCGGQNGACARWNGRYGGKEALSYVNHNGYVSGRIFNIGYQSHRVIWAMVHNEWPENDIDHIDHNRGNNRIDNLRSVTRLENLRNISIQKNNTSGVLGVRLACGRWVATIMVNHKSINLGSFSCLEDAKEARRRANIKYGFHKNHGVTI